MQDYHHCSLGKNPKLFLPHLESPNWNVGGAMQVLPSTISTFVIAFLADQQERDHCTSTKNSLCAAPLSVFEMKQPSLRQHCSHTNGENAH